MSRLKTCRRFGFVYINRPSEHFSTEELDGTYHMGGVDAIYSHPEPEREKLIVSGPLKDDLVFHVINSVTDYTAFR